MKTRPHVLMTADAVGGVWTYALDLGRELAQAGVQVTLAVPGPAPDDDQRVQAKAAGLALEPLGGALDWTATHKGEVAATATRLFQLCTRLRPDLIHLNSPALAAFGPFHAPVLAACHSCMKTWWDAVRGEEPLPDDLAWRAALIELGYANVSALVAPSRAFAEATRIAYDLPAAPSIVLNGRQSPILPSWGRRTSESGEGGCAATSSWNPLSPRRSQLLQRESIYDAALFTAGRLWDAGKDVATLDRAVGRTDLPAAAAGALTGPDGQTLTLHNVQLLGRLSEADVKARLSRRPIFVSPSLYEPFGLAALEAAQAACPLVLSDIATFRELWDGAAAFFPPGDDAALAIVLSELAADANRRTNLGEAALARAARYTAAAMTDATLRLYTRLSPAFTRTEAAA